MKENPHISNGEKKEITKWKQGVLNGRVSSLDQFNFDDPEAYRRGYENIDWSVPVRNDETR